MIDIEKLEKEEVFELIEVIGVNKIREEMKKDSFFNRYSNERRKDFISNIIWQNIYAGFIRKILRENIESIIEDITNQALVFKEKYGSYDKAFIMSLYTSNFNKHLKLYFKIIDVKYSSNDYLRLLQIIMTAVHIDFSCENFEKKGEKELSEKSKKLFEDYRRLQAEFEKIKAEKIVLSERCESLKCDKSKAETKLIDSEKRIKIIESEKCQLEENLNKYVNANSNLSSLESEINLKRNMYDKLKIRKKELESKISDLSQEAIDWENEIKQLKLKHTQISAQVDSEIKSFSDNLVNSAVFTALMNKASDRNKNSESEKIYIEIPETDKLNAEKITDVNKITDILSYNLHMTGIIKNSNEWAKVFLSAIYSSGNIIIYGNNLSETADAVSLSVFAEYPAHVVLPLNTGDIPYYINMINNIDRKVIFIDNCFDALSDKLCISLTKYCKSKILIFGLNDINSLKCISKLNVFSNIVYINLNNIQSYPVKQEYKIAYWDIVKKDCNTELLEKIYNKKLFQNIIKDFDIPFSFARFLTEIKYNYSELYKIHERKIIVSELMLYFMINDMISSEEAKNFIKLLKENDDDKIELIETLLGEVE